jgi:hypothetical protein
MGTDGKGRAMSITLAGVLTGLWPGLVCGAVVGAVVCFCTRNLTTRTER